MKILKVQFYPWDNKLYEFSSGDYDVKIGDKIVAKTDLGLEVGTVKEIAEPKEVSENDEDMEEIKVISRLATRIDLKKIEEKNQEKEEAKKYCREAVKKNGLPMKIVDVFFTLDGGHIIFTFVADGRVDFRELVKDLTRHFQKSIRMQQIGIRDEAKIIGGIGVCGRELCCRKILKVLVNIRSDLLKLQQLENKASDRLSGVCGRLMCCLAYEQETYKECCHDIPQVGEEIKYGEKSGVVVSRHILKRTVNIKDDEGVVVEVEVDKLKK